MPKKTRLHYNKKKGEKGLPSLAAFTVCLRGCPGQWSHEDGPEDKIFYSHLPISTLCSVKSLPVPVILLPAAQHSQVFCRTGSCCPLLDTSVDSLMENSRSSAQIFHLFNPKSTM